MIVRERTHPLDFDFERFFDEVEACYNSFDNTALCDAMRPRLQYVTDTGTDIRDGEYRYAVVELSDGTKVTFVQTVDPNGQVTGG